MTTTIIRKPIEIGSGVDDWQPRVPFEERVYLNGCVLDPFLPLVMPSPAPVRRKEYATKIIPAHKCAGCPTIIPERTVYANTNLIKAFCPACIRERERLCKQRKREECTDA